MSILAERASSIPPNNRPDAIHPTGRPANEKPVFGRARRRQLRRQRRKRWLSQAVRVFALVWLLAGAVLPLLIHTYTNTQAASANPVSQGRAVMQMLPETAISAGYMAATPTWLPPTQTATATLFPTASPTSTPLPAGLIQATAWQATLDIAAGFSHATQTQAAGQYRATQTALPPILTANALDREATATAAVP
jgi:hypothetical protein